MPAAITYRIVQPWGRDRAREATLISEHDTVSEAFSKIDRLSEQMRKSGAPPNAIDLIVVNSDGSVIARPDAH